MAIFKMHSSPICPACRSVLMAADYLRLELDVISYNLITGDFKTPAYKKMNPTLTLPTIDDDGFYLYEGRAVLAYMLNKYAPESPVYPSDPAERAVVDRMLYFDSGTLYRTQWGVMTPMVYQNKPADPEKVKEFENTFKLLNGFLEKTAYVAGNHITIADFAIIANLSSIKFWLDYSFDKYPKISAWMAKMKKEIPSYEKINEIPVKEYKKFLTKRLEYWNSS